MLVNQNLKKGFIGLDFKNLMFKYATENRVRY